MKHPPERPLVISVDTREPAIEANDHPDTVFRPRVFAAGIPRGTPYTEWPRVEVPTVRTKLNVGDYSLPGLETMVALERKSGPDLLATLFGSAGLDSVGAAKNNLDRFRAELERAYAARYQLFAIVVEGSDEWLDVEADRRTRRYGKSFDPQAARAILRSFAIDLACPTIWCAARWHHDDDGARARFGVGHPLKGRQMPPWLSAKEAAEIEVGSVLARVWSEATGGEKARDAKKRGYDMAWLDALAERVEEVAT